MTASRANSKPSRLNQKQYAKHRGVKPQYISRLVREGKIAVSTRDGLIDPVKADKALGPRGRRPQPPAARPLKSSKPLLRVLRAESSTASLTAARARKATADAELAELQVGHERGRLLLTEEVLQAQRQQNANIRTRLRMLPRALAPLLANVTMAAEIERIILEFIDRELSDLARDPLALASPALQTSAPAGDTSAAVAANSPAEAAL